MIHVTRLRTLDLASPPAPDRPSHLSAASGLVRAGDFFYVIADDEHHLGVFSVLDDTPGRLIRLLPGELPSSKSHRKAVKPDFEALVRLPPSAEFPFGSLLAIGSGSGPARRRGILLALDAHGTVCRAPRVIDLSRLYDVLRANFVELNIEGAVVQGNRLTLLQRGNAGNPHNACIDMDLMIFHAIADGVFGAGTNVGACMAACDLGSIDNVPLCFSDAAALPNGDLVFTAIAEDTADSYNDGPCVGAAIGIMKPGGRIHFIEPLDSAYKVEGIEAEVRGDAVQLSMVTDADDPDAPALLLSAQLHGYPFDG